MEELYLYPGFLIFEPGIYSTNLINQQFQFVAAESSEAKRFTVK
jgi:hypothetical protein